MLSPVQLALALGAALALGWTQAGPAPPDLAGARARVLDRIRASGAEVAVIWRPLDARPGEDLAIEPTLRFHAASTMKVPVMIELFQQALDGRLKLDDTVVVTNTFKSLADGSPYELSAGEDSDGETYRAIGHPLHLREFVEEFVLGHFAHKHEIACPPQRGHRSTSQPG
jgi:beta-lactamase class A